MKTMKTTIRFLTILFFAIGISLSCEKDDPVISVASVSVNKPTLNLVEGESEVLVGTVLPENADNKRITWSSSKTDIASVDNNGKITAIKAGSATITATTVDGGKSATCQVTVSAKTIAVTGVELNKTGIQLRDGETETLKATVLPADATNKNVTWKSNKEDIASVDKNGKITAIKAGTAEITVTTEDGNKTEKCYVSVRKSEYFTEGTVILKYITNHSVVKEKESLYVGQSFSVAVGDAKITDVLGFYNVKWKSSNTSVATVTPEGSGVYMTVSAHKSGTSIISVEDERGDVLSFELVVKKPETPTVRILSLVASGEFGMGKGRVAIEAIIDSDGGASITEKGIESEEFYKGTIDAVVTKVSGNNVGKFNFSDQNIAVQGELLRYRAYARNSVGISYSEWKIAYTNP